MRDIIKYFESQFTSQKDAAAALDYSERQWLNIRRKVEKGEALSPQTERHINTKYKALRHVN